MCVFVSATNSSNHNLKFSGISKLDFLENNVVEGRGIEPGYSFLDEVFLIPTPKCSKRSCHDVARQNDYHNIIASFSLHGEDVWQLNLFVFIVHLLHYIFSPRFGVWCSYLSCTEFIIL